MPEALVVVPLLQIPSGNSSEMGNSSTTAETTDRSTDSHIDTDNHQVAAKEKKLAVKSQAKNKLRRSHGKRFQKKNQLKSSPALLITPSTSATSLATNDSLESPLIPVASVKTAAALGERRLKETTTSSRSHLVRQNTGLILAFRQRKSISQMDFSHARRQMNFSIATSPSSHHNTNDNTLMPSSCGENMSVAFSKTSLMSNVYNQDYYFGMAMPKRDPQMAGMRIFATIMLNAWRKRRAEVRHLTEEIADLKRGAVKAKNQIHVFSSLFRVEQKRNDELNCQLKRSLEDINLTKSSCESLTTSLISMKADKALLEQQLLIKEQEYESINTFLTQTKTDLFKSMTQQRELQASLSTEQRNIQTLQNQKNDLINEICELNSEAIQKEEDLRKEVQEKCDELSKMRQKLNGAEEQIKMLNVSTQQQLSELKTREDRMSQEIETLQNELKVTNKCLEETLGSRLKNCWNNSVTYQKLTLQMLHWLAYYTLPATPPPKLKALPFTLSLDKALSIVRR